MIICSISDGPIANFRDFIGSNPSSKYNIYNSSLLDDKSTLPNFSNSQKKIIYFLVYLEN